jgi:hypothetical protein
MAQSSYAVVGSGFFGNNIELGSNKGLLSAIENQFLKTDIKAPASDALA